METAVRIESRVRAALLLALTVAGAWLRLRNLGTPALWLDEILNVDFARGFFDRPPIDWMRGFESENGPLYYFLQAIWLGVDAPLEITFRLSAVLLGIVSIPLLAVALRPLGSRVALIAAVLLAASPIHVYYSREGRPYAALVLFAIILMGAIARASCGAGVPPASGSGTGREAGSVASNWNWTRAAMVIPFLAAASAATAAPLLVASGAVFLVLAIISRSRSCFQAAAAHGFALAYLAFLYFRFERNEVAAGFPTDALGTLERIISSLFGELFTERAPASPLLVIAMLLLAVGGAAILARRRETRGVVVMGLSIIALTVGALALSDHWLSPRYLLPAVPMLLACAAVGLDAAAGAVARFVSRRTSRAEFLRAHTAGSILLALALAVPVAAIAREDALWKADWKSMTATLLAHARAGDDVVAADGWVAHSLRHHLKEAGSSLRVIDVGGSAARAEPVVGRRPRVWLMSGGYGSPGDAAGWMRCRFMLVASEPVENLRLYYAPGLTDFLVHRATQREVERLGRSFQEGAGGRFEMGTFDEPFLENWYARDTVGGTEVRWARERSSLLVPRWPAGSRMRFNASPIETPMEMAVSVDGAPAGSIEFRDGEATYAIRLPDVGPDMHRIDLAFPRTVRPSDIAESADERRLTVLFNWIEIGPAPRAIATAGFAFRPDRATAAREPRIVPRTLPPIAADRLRRLLHEAGYDPAREMPRLRARTADLVGLIADAIDADCGSDEEFIRRLYLLLMNVLPDEEGTKGYLARLRRGATREQIIDWTLETWAKARGTGTTEGG